MLSFIFILCVYENAYMYACTSHTSLVLKFQAKPLCQYWEPNLFPLQEQQVLLTLSYLSCSIHFHLKIRLIHTFDILLLWILKIFCFVLYLDVLSILSNSLWNHFFNLIKLIPQTISTQLCTVV